MILYVKTNLNFQSSQTKDDHHGRKMAVVFGFGPNTALLRCTVAVGDSKKKTSTSVLNMTYFGFISAQSVFTLRRNAMLVASQKQ